MSRKKSKLRAVIFDYGEVLSMPQAPADVEAMAAILGLESARFARLYRKFRRPYDRGELDGPAYWERIAGAARADLSARRIRTLIAIDSRSWARTNGVLVAWIESLRTAGLRLGLLSNMPAELRAYCRRVLPWIRTFDHASFSCEVGAVKPAAAIYRHCLAGLEVEPAQALFIDDVPANVRAAARIGINSIRFEGNARLATAVRAFRLPALNL
jgi:putative hydrolase of the HAD superfamily